MADFFEFETDFVNSLRCIPMQVRYKLDTCGIKLKLSDWHQMTIGERKSLVELACTTAADIQAYRKYLQDLIIQHTGTTATNLAVDPQPPWLDSENIPASLTEKFQAIGVTLTLQQWADLRPLQRFVLIKLSRPGHENQNFPRAIAEFNLI
ncbi:nitrate reductase associated protein [Fortiea contorta]|uniref:nitrate reductase associated protein n=1 Tax=Fortiea contorta TaxID=1892405 RepID=UPI0004759243|nr:nitrate reductase associated protein [Fortiea contorta]